MISASVYSVRFFGSTDPTEVRTEKNKSKGKRKTPEPGRTNPQGPSLTAPLT